MFSKSQLKDVFDEVFSEDESAMAALGAKGAAELKENLLDRLIATFPNEIYQDGEEDEDEDKEEEDDVGALDFD